MIPGGNIDKPVFYCSSHDTHSELILHTVTLISFQKIA